VLAEPHRTPYDLVFPLAGIPVRVHPFFWLTAVLLGSGGIVPGIQPMTQLLMWVAIVFVSILVHEMGHALAIRYFGWRPWITLYAFGGLASYEPGYSQFGKSYNRKGNTTLGQIIIHLAGPVAGFLLAGVVVVALFATGRRLVFPLFIWDVELGRGQDFDNIWLLLLTWQVLAVNIYWGLMNLLPVYPLDGGKISRDLLVAANTREGVTQSLWVSIVVAGMVAVYGASRDDWWLAILFGMLAYQSFQMLQMQRGGGGRPW
jgi:Zn-dependent protease